MLIIHVVYAVNFMSQGAVAVSSIYISYRFPALKGTATVMYVPEMEVKCIPITHLVQSEDDAEDLAGTPI